MKALQMYLGGSHNPLSGEYGLFFNHGNANTDEWHLRSSRLSKD